MATQTPNIDLTLPIGTEKVSRQIVNDNNTKIDTAVGSLNSKLFSKLDATTNFNNIANDGIYLLDWVSGGTSYNRPLNAGGRLEHSTSTVGIGETKQQIYITYAGQVFARGYSNGAWTAWQELALNSEVLRADRYLDITVDIASGSNFSTKATGVAANRIVSTKLIYSDDVYYNPCCVAINSAGEVNVKLFSNATAARSYTVRVYYI